LFTPDYENRLAFGSETQYVKAPPPINKLGLQTLAAEIYLRTRDSIWHLGIWGTRGIRGEAFYTTWDSLARRPRFGHSAQLGEAREISEYFGNYNSPISRSDPDQSIISNRTMVRSGSWSGQWKW